VGGALFCIILVMKKGRKESRWGLGRQTSRFRRLDGMCLQLSCPGTDLGNIWPAAKWLGADPMLFKWALGPRVSTPAVDTAAV
jgi:hypothetical protein